jgi:predicted site-specific integrase-resolvase
VSGASIRKRYDVSPTALRSWADQGKIKVVRAASSTGRRLYSLADFLKVVGADVEAHSRRRICYARVSSPHQRPDLERQSADLINAFPAHELIHDIGSGLNWKRPGLLSILDAVCSGLVKEVVVAHRDRLARIGVELLEWLFKRYDTKFVVLYQGDDHEHSDSEELRDDLLAVVTFFVARNNGRRAAANRKRRRDAATTLEEAENQEEPRQTKRRKDSTNPSLPNTLPTCTIALAN